MKALAALSLILGTLRAEPTLAQATDSSAVRADVPLCSRVRQGMLARVSAGGRGGLVGPILGCDEETLVLGPYLDSTQKLVPAGAVRHVWLRARAGGTGLLVGASVGGAMGVLFTAIRSNVCPNPSNPYLPTSVNCGGNVRVGAATGLAIGGLIGWVLGRGFPRWRQVYP